LRKSNIEDEPDNFLERSGPTTAKVSSEYSPLGAFSRIAELICFMARKLGWSFAEQRLLIELARASKSLDEAAKVIGRKPASIKKMALRLGISFKASAKKG
jgi:hypothetical protein